MAEGAAKAREYAELEAQLTELLPMLIQICNERNAMAQSFSGLAAPSLSAAAIIPNSSATHPGLVSAQGVGPRAQTPTEEKEQKTRQPGKA